VQNKHRDDNSSHNQNPKIEIAALKYNIQKALQHRGQLAKGRGEFSCVYTGSEYYLINDKALDIGSTASVHEAWLIQKQTQPDSYQFTRCAIKHFLDDFDKENSSTYGNNEFKVLNTIYPETTKQAIISGRMFLVMPFFRGKPLCNDKGIFDPVIAEDMPIQQKFDLINAIIENIELLHNKGYTHCDISAQNILFLISEETGKIQAHLIDFGLARKIGSTSAVIDSPGTPGYIAPERTKQPTQLTNKTDIFSLTPIIALILGASNPLQPKLLARQKKRLQDKSEGGDGYEAKQIAHQNAAEAKAKYDLAGMLPQDPHLKDRIIPLLQSMQDPDPTKRPNITVVKEFFQQLQKKHAAFIATTSTSSPLSANPLNDITDTPTSRLKR
jgi:serine/threonine protein kinase